MTAQVEPRHSASERLQRSRSGMMHHAFCFEAAGQTVVGAAVLGLAAWWTDSPWIPALAACFGLVLAARTVEWAAHACRRIDSTTAQRAFVAGSILQGLTWAVSITVLFPALDLPQRLNLASLIVAHSAGVAVSLALSSSSTAGFLVPVVAALCVQIAASQETEARVFAVVFLLFLPVTFLLTRKIRAAGLENIRLRLEAERREAKLEESHCLLQAEEERYRRLFESSEDAMWVMRDHRFVMANDAACRILGYAGPSAFREVHPGDISPPNQPDGRSSFEKAERMMREAYRKGYNRFHWTHMRSDGTVFPAEVTLTVLATDPVPELFAVVRDVTEHQVLVDEMRRAGAAAEAANRAKSEFLATMSHEIRTPMNAVLGMSELLQGTDLDEEQAEFVATIASSGDSLLSLINDILDFSKIEAGKLELGHEEFDLAQLVADVGRLLASSAKSKGIELRVDSRGLELRQVVGDPTRIRQMLVNLVGNAIKFTEQGHVALRASSSKMGQGQAGLHLEVEDTGIGIAHEAQEHLFDPFVQADTSTTRYFGGTGLGLAITRRLAEAMDGSIDLTSAPGEGSTFSVHCHVGYRGEGTRGVSSSRTEVQGRAEMGEMQGCVLVVEDALPNQKLAEKMLGLMGLDVRIAENGRVGVDMYESSEFDLVLMDLQMPVMDGYDATRGIRRIQQQRSEFTPICAVTANVTPDDRARCNAVGMDGFLGKPYNFSQLRSKVEELLQQSLELR